MLQIERKLVLKAIGQLEEITKKSMHETHPGLEKQLLENYWENEKYLRKARFNLDQVIDNLNLEKFDLKEFYRDADEKIKLLDEEQAEIYKTPKDSILLEEITYLVKRLNEKYPMFEWAMVNGQGFYKVLVEKGSK